MHKFCIKEEIDLQAIQIEAATALKQFMDIEANEVQSGERSSCINCSINEIESLIDCLGISSDEFPRGWQELCQDP
jgi:hypothetical protein